jgi:hypothetical protein
MLARMYKVLAPHVKMAPKGVLLILLLDSFRCNMMTSVVTKIQDLGGEVDHIPGNCTCLCQPVDVGTREAFQRTIDRQVA